MLIPTIQYAQTLPLTADKLWGLGRVSAMSIVPNSNEVLYSVRHTNLANEHTEATYYFVDITTQKLVETKILIAYCILLSSPVFPI